MMQLTKQAIYLERVERSHLSFFRYQRPEMASLYKPRKEIYMTRRPDSCMSARDSIHLFYTNRVVVG